MMNKQKTSKAGLWKVATFLPLLALLLMAFGRTGENVQKISTSEKKVLNQEKSNEKGSVTQFKDSIYTKVEVMPQFPGGDRAIQKFLIENVKYPKEASAKNIQGKVFVNCIINKEGKIVDSKVVKGVDPLLDAEALRVIRLMPNWIPGKNEGKSVSSSFTIPINFVLSPGPSDKTDTPTPPIFIELNKQGILLMKELVSLDEFRKQLPVIVKNNPRSEIWLGIIDKSDYKKDSVNDILKKAGVWSKVKYK